MTDADSKICGNRHCRKVFYREPGDRQWDRRHYCCRPCQHRENNFQQNAKRAAPSRPLRKPARRVSHETHMGHYEVKHPILLNYLRGQ